MCKYCERGDDNERLINAATDCGFLGKIYFDAHINSITEDYATENGYQGDDFDDSLRVFVCTNNGTVGRKIKINYCPICGRKLGD